VLRNSIMVLKSVGKWILNSPYLLFGIIAYLPTLAVEALVEPSLPAFGKRLHSALGGFITAVCCLAVLGFWLAGLVVTIWLIKAIWYAV